MNGSNLPKIKDEKGSRLAFPRHLGESRASRGHTGARKVLLTG